jgi:hypothetical protein
MPKFPVRTDAEAPLPTLMELAEFRRHFGNISHTQLYKLAAEGHVRIVKLGYSALSSSSWI